MTSPPTIAVIGGDSAGRAQMARLLAGCGFPRVLSADSLGGLRDLAITPDLVLLTVEADATGFLTEAREQSLWLEVPVLAISPSVPPGADASLLAAGADEVVRDPPQPAVLGQRVRGLLRRQEMARRVREMLRVNDAMREIQSLVSQGGDAPEVLRQVLMISVGVLGFERGTLIAHVESSERAYVIAATDDPTLQQFCLTVSSYPEISAALRGGQPILIGDTQSHPITSGVADALRARRVAALAVFPCFWRRRGLGALLFRKPDPGIEHLTSARVNFGVVLAGQVAAQLRDSHIVEHMSEATRRISRASYEAERRLRTIESLKEHFDASADGVVVLDDAGRILFVNGAAESITGFARDGLVGSPLVDLVPLEQRAPVEEVISSVLGGTNLEAFDLDLSTTSGEPICVSVTTSTVLAKSGAVILSFRDVTAERALESELQQTKDFLERLIDSAVDAIVAADMQGHVILFNPGAERIFGQRAEEVIGQLMVHDLYPPGTARQVMEMLRSPEHGGVGRLEQTQLEVQSEAGELIPVNMTASILYENGHEAATVGILNDLRDRLRMEERLRDVQAQLEMQERQAMVAQLAGAAAHELNQPLTSILGYGQLIERQSEPDAPHMRAVQIIQSEAARMADIVRNIGRITRYETKQYVGSASIMDLDASASSSPRIELDKDLDDAFDIGAHDETGLEAEPGELGEVTQVADLLRGVGDSPPLDELALADMTAGLAGPAGPLGRGALIEPAEEEVTAQHVILPRQIPPADSLPKAGFGSVRRNPGEIPPADSLPKAGFGSVRRNPGGVPRPVTREPGTRPGFVSVPQPGADARRSTTEAADRDERGEADEASQPGAEGRGDADQVARAGPVPAPPPSREAAAREAAAPEAITDDESVDVMVDEGELVDEAEHGRPSSDDGEPPSARESTGDFSIEEVDEEASAALRADPLLREQSSDPTG